MKTYIKNFNKFVNESVNINDKMFSLEDLLRIITKHGEKKAKITADSDMYKDHPTPTWFEDEYDYKIGDDGKWPDPSDEDEDEEILRYIDVNMRPKGEEYDGPEGRYYYDKNQDSTLIHNKIGPSGKPKQETQW